MVLVLVLARIAFAAWIPHHDAEAVRSPDTPSYVGPARSLLQDGRFDEFLGSERPMFVRTPGYPVFLAAILGVDDDEDVVSPIQAVVSALTVLAVWFVARRLAGPLVAAVAALVVALDPLQFVAAGMLLTESLAAVSLAAVAVAGFFVFRPPPDEVRPIAAVALGVALAVATLIRPTTYYLPLVLVVLLVVRARRTGLRRTLVLAGCFLLPVVVLLGGWQVRNARVVESSRFSAVESINLYCHRAAGAEAIERGVHIDVVRTEYGCDGYLNGVPGRDDCAPWWDCPRGRDEPEGPYHDEMASRGREILLHHPRGAVVMTARGLLRVGLGPGTETVARYLSVESSPLLTLPLAAWTVSLTVAAAAGLWLARGRPGAWYAGFLACVAGYVIVASAGPEGFARMRGPVEPLLVLLAVPVIARVVGRRATAAPAS